jgi:hypothetical protein
VTGGCCCGHHRSRAAQRGALDSIDAGSNVRELDEVQCRRLAGYATQPSAALGSSVSLKIGISAARTAKVDEPAAGVAVVADPVDKDVD